MGMIDDIIKRNLDRLIDAKGTSRTRLAVELNKGPNYFHDYFKGVKKSLKTSDLDQIVKALDISIAELLGIDASSSLSKDPSSVDTERLAQVITLIETALDEDDSDLPLDKKARLVALCYDHMYTDETSSNNVIDLRAVRGLINLAS